MFKNTVPLNPDRHRHLRFVADQPYHFAAREMLIPVVSGEMELTAREYPVLFPASVSMPLALTGLEKGVNRHVRESGHWAGRYVPAHIRRYPFIAVSGENKSYTIQVDTQAPHFSRETGERIYDDTGQPGPLLEKVIKILKSLRVDELRTMKLVAQLDRAGLLISRNMQVEGGREITGFRIVDRAALFSLDPETLSKLHSTGALHMAYAHMLSLTNLKDGLLAQKKEDPQAPPEGGLFLSDDDTLNFDF